MAKKPNGGKAHHPRHALPTTLAAAVRAGLTQLPDELLTDLVSAGRSEAFALASPAKSTRTPCGVLPLADGGFKLYFLDPETGLCDKCFSSELKTVEEAT